MSKKPKFSVIIPVYNVEKYLVECLDSVTGQTLDEIEIICVDNGSSDKSLDILRKYEKKDKRIKVLEIGRSDAGTARNAGLSIAQGEYLYFIDSDDYCEKELLEKTYNVITKDNSDVLVFRAEQFDSETRESTILDYSLVTRNLPKKNPFRPIDMKEHIFNSFQNWPWNKVFRHDFIKENGIVFQEVVRANDVMFVYLALTLAKKISVLDEVLIHYRVGNKNSLQATNHLAPVAFWDAYRRTKKVLERAGVYEEYEKSYLNETMKGCLYNYQSVKTAEAKEYIFALLKYGSEIEFGFLKHGRKYYEDTDTYDKFREIVETKSASLAEVAKMKKDYEKVLLEKQGLESEKQKLEEGIQEIRNSRAHKVGMALTSLPRKIKSIIKGN